MWGRISQSEARVCPAKLVVLQFRKAETALLTAPTALPGMHGLVLHVPSLYFLLVKEHALLFAEVLIAFHPLITKPAEIAACIHIALVSRDIEHKDVSIAVVVKLPCKV